jgi:hypothetical protein
MLLRLSAILAGAILPIVSAVPPAPRAALPRQDAARDPDAAETCGTCHTEIYREWKGRAHANAWTDPLYQRSLADKEKPQVCHGCHIPGPVLEKLGQKPTTRKTHLEEGITCVSCHKLGDKIQGPFGAETDAHPSEKNPVFTDKGSVALCSGCHDKKIGPVLPLAKDYEEAKIAETGETCVGCHMPAVERHLAISIATGKPTGEARKGRQHTVLGPGDVEFCAKAFALDAERDGKDVVLSVENKAGHRIPGLTLRKFAVAVRQLDAKGSELGQDQVEISAENELKATETREFRFAAKEGAVKVSIEIDHYLDGKKVDRVKAQQFDL